MSSFGVFKNDNKNTGSFQDDGDYLDRHARQERLRFIPLVQWCRESLKIINLLTKINTEKSPRQRYIPPMTGLEQIY